jgi:hypothetical protein
MTGIKIQFGKNEATLDLNSKVTGNLAQVQNILVNVSTEAPAPVFESRGTDLLQSFARTGFISQVYAQHAANFAALDALFFCKSFNRERSQLSGVTLIAPASGRGDLTFSLEVDFSENTIQTPVLL